MKPQTPQALLNELRRKVDHKRRNVDVPVSVDSLLLAIVIIEEWNNQNVSTNASMSRLMGECQHHG